jgi:3-deoxy-manno-octulosonate cytidylyltransferase (CMP-KDO synthetase)
MNVAIVIPARYGSRRFPGKPLATIRGRSLLQRTWSIARAVKDVAEVHIATDDPRIADHAEQFGASVVMTSPDCANGTERVLAALRELKLCPDAVVNLQGDAALTPPWVVEAVVKELSADPKTRLVTPAVRCSFAHYREIELSKRANPESGTLVTFDRDRNALYFSKSLIPHLRVRGEDPPPVYQHVGIYGYRTETLEALGALAEGPLERAEQLEQLRALENGIPIRIVVVDYRGRTNWSVDTPEDAAMVESIIIREGELLSA